MEENRMVRYDWLSRSGARHHWWFGVATVAAFLLVPASVQGRPFAYVTHNKVSQYEVVAGGLLAPLRPVTVAAAGDPGGVAVSADGKSLYVANESSEGDDSGVSQYDISPGGALSPKTPPVVHRGSFPSGMYGVAVSPDADSVYVTFRDGRWPDPNGWVLQYDVGPGGELSPKSPAKVLAGQGASGIAMDPNSRSVYVVDSYSPWVYQYDVGPGGGLSPKSAVRVGDPVSELPWTVAVSPDGHSTYVANLSYGGVSQYDVDPGGALSPKSPARVDLGRGEMPGVAVSPDGQSVYATVSWAYGAAGSVSQYDVGPGGELSSKRPATVGAGAYPDGVAVSPDGQSVYVSNSGSGDVWQYDVDAAGRLSPKSPARVAGGIGDGAAVVVSPLLRPTTKNQCRRGGGQKLGFKKSRKCIRAVKRKARHNCRGARDLLGRRAFRKRYGNAKHQQLRVMRRCIQDETGSR